MYYSSKLVIIFCFTSIANSGKDFRFPQSGHDFRRTPNQTGFKFHYHHHQGPKTIPLDLIRRLNSVENITELHKFIDPTSFDTAEGDSDLIGNRFGEDQNKVVVPRPAGCNKPEMKAVPLKESTDPSLFYFPACILVARCGGCCSSDLFSCQPIQQETIDYQVIISQYEGGNTMVYKGKEIVSMEQHIKCKCDCITKEKDCNKLQEYQRDDCRCVCLNMGDQRKCDLNNDTKVWNPRTCVCACRDTKECSTGYYYSQASCSCLPIPESGTISPEARRRRAARKEATQDSVPTLQGARQGGE